VSHSRRAVLAFTSSIGLRERGPRAQHSVAGLVPKAAARHYRGIGWARSESGRDRTAHARTRISLFTPFTTFETDRLRNPRSVAALDSRIGSAATTRQHEVRCSAHLCVGRSRPKRGISMISISRAAVFALILSLAVSGLVTAGPFEDGSDAWERGDYGTAMNVSARLPNEVTRELNTKSA
jgi:hypothetical protein